MWKLANNNLPTVARINDPTVQGLELTELGGLEIRAPLFRFQPLANYSISRRSSTPSSTNPGVGTEPVIDTSTILEPEQVLYLYVIDYFWDIFNYDKTLSINQLGAEKYSHFLEKTYILTPEATTTLNLTTSFFAYVPQPDSTYTYQINLGTTLNIDTISEVVVAGLVFRETGNLTFSFESSTGTLLINANKYCRPEQGELVEIVVEKELTLANQTRNRVYEFDTSALNLSAVSYLEYKGKSYSQANTLSSGTLFNNYYEKKVYAIE